jgi:uncharacterized phage protein (TIGR02218 family)
VTRRDGVVLGFTDHDRDLAFEGVVFRAGTGMTARARQQATGLGGDNSEAEGALSDAAIREEDILAGRFDGAEVAAWAVDWEEPAARGMQFRGTTGEISRAGGAFRAELRGLTEVLNTPQGRVIQAQCTAVLGDGACRFDLTAPGFAVERTVEEAEGGRILRWAVFAGHDDRWFERGRLTVLDGAAAGIVALVKNDRQRGAGREVELWQAVLPGLAPGDMLRLEAGCDKRAETCRVKFGNFLNFRGFPHIPGEDWLTAYPRPGQPATGGSREAGSRR